jgi:hypothetical protein
VNPVHKSQLTSKGKLRKDTECTLTGSINDRRVALPPKNEYAARILQPEEWLFGL